ncbi:hypothetical protein HOY80DRAFT_986642 [Tuber brumale]|nr:hypothetical protein HOY80DRAFT_986642 [Tuber brumale]
MMSTSGGRGPFPAATTRPPEDNPHAPTESTNEEDAITHPKSDQSGSIFDNETPRRDVSKEHSQSQSPSPALTPLQIPQIQLDKAKFQKEIAIIQARAQHSPLAKLAKLRLSTETPTEAATSPEPPRYRNRKKQKEVALLPPDIQAPREEGSTIESLGIICYCVISLYVCAVETFGYWMAGVLMDPVLAVVVGIVFWAVVEALGAFGGWLGGRV